MRAYGTAPQIWGGRQDCEHTWGDRIPGDSRGGSGPGSKSVRSGDDKSTYGRNAERGRFCTSCGAWEGELGLEPTPDLFVDHLVEIFREVRRVLRKDGTLFLNIADTYVSKETDCTWGKLKQKDLYGIPHRLAQALQKDGWYWRNDAIWGKAGGNCPRCYYRIEKGSSKPEPVKDRFARAHEYVFLLAKSKRYYFDSEAVKESHSAAKRRDVFYIPSQSFRGAHYAVMPDALADVCVKGGTSEHGACAKCRAPYKRVIKKGAPDKERQKAGGGNDDGEYAGKNTKDYEKHGAEGASDLKRRILAGMKKITTVGWEQTCKCKDPGDPIPCLVMDPFSGAATTGASALRLGRRYLGLELLESNNTDIAEPRLKAALEAKKPATAIDYLPLTSMIYHGKAEIFLPRVPPESVRLILTDPPYNTSRKNNFHTMGRTGIDFDWDGDFDQEEWIRLADKALMKGGSLVIWNDWKNLGIIAHLLMDMGYDVKRNLTWIKSNPMPRNKERSIVQRTETGLWAVKPGAKWVFNRQKGKHYEDGLYQYGVPRAKKGRPRHQSKKPDELFQNLIRTFTNKGELVLDPFAGGGTTAYAASKEGRKHISIEDAQEWYEESIRHWLDADNTTSAALHILASFAPEENSDPKSTTHHEVDDAGENLADNLSAV